MFREPKFEPQGSENSPEQKNSPAEGMGENSLPPEQIQSAPDSLVGQENKEAEGSLDAGFAAEFKEMPKRGFFRKLKKLAGALALAGLFLFSPQESVAPEASKEAWAVKDLGYTLEYQPELYKEILEQIKEKGGVFISPQFPETVYRPREVSVDTGIFAHQSETPFYNRPEVILGGKFIKEHPEKAREYYEKISTVMRATVKLINGKRGQGSGVIVKGKGNRSFVLTNAHVCGEGEILTAYFSSGGLGKDMRVVIKNKTDDIAVLEFIDEGEEELHSLAALNIAKTSEVRLSNYFSGRGETIAAIGNPLGFPFAVGIGKRPPVLAEIYPGRIFYYPDARFSQLELYSGIFPEVAIDWDKVKKWGEDGGTGNTDSWDIFKMTQTEKFFFKGDAIPGMSGGPIISLDTEGEPELIGLNRSYFRDRGAARNKLGEGVSADTIKKFLEDNNLI